MTAATIIVVGIIFLITTGALIVAVRGLLKDQVGEFEIRLLYLLSIRVRARDLTDAGSTQCPLRDYCTGPHSQN
jgi:hypothetical protein